MRIKARNRLPWRLRILLGIFFAGALSIAARADLCPLLLARTPQVGFSNGARLGIGHKVSLEFPPKIEKSEGYFLGRMVDQSGVSMDAAFYDPERQIIHVVPIDFQLEVRTASGAAVSQEALIPVVRTPGQVGGTCAAYALYSCLRQLHMWNIRGNAKVGEKLADETSRQRMLMKFVNTLYIEQKGGSSQERLIWTTAAELGYKVTTLTGSKVPSTVPVALKAGHPVLIRFDVRSDMTPMPYKVKDLAKGKEYSNRLWLPKSSFFQLKNGGHAVVLLGVFEAGGRQFILVADPNWQLPRLWSIDELDHFGNADMQAWVFE